MDKAEFAVEFSPRASLDVSTAFAYYKDIRHDLAQGFIEELDWVLVFIASHPHSFQRVRDDSNIRRAVMHRFPYVIAYELWQEKIIVLRVRSSHQDPAGLI